MLSQLSVLCALCVLWVPTQCQTEPYTVPNAHIEVFHPRGIRISIPDYPGVRLFAVHAVINRELNGLEAGDISRDVLKKSGDRWVFEDKKLKLNHGDVMNYWLFVIKGHLGYRLDDQTYTITEFQEAPFGFNNGNGPNRRPTTPRPFGEGAPQYVPAATLPPFACNCPPPTPPSTTPSCAASTTSPPSAAVPPQIPADLAIWRELLVNMSTENADFRNQVAMLYENNQLLVNKLERLGDENLKKLRLEGRVLQDDTPIEVVKTVFTEKLRIQDTRIVKNAVRNDDGSITFEMRTVEDKLMVLRVARDKLSGTKFSIKDIDAISFMNQNTGQVLIDMRSQ